MKTKKQSLLRFFSMLYGICEQGYVELRPLTSDCSPVKQLRSWTPISDLQKLVDEAWKLREKHHLFYGVATRTRASKKQKKATQEFTASLPTLFADLDFEDYKGGRDEALEIIRDFPFPPSSLIFSGNGFHAYYFLEEPHNLDGDVVFRIKKILKVLQNHLLQADSTSDVTRVLRVPYSINIKDPSHPKLVEIKELNNRRYRLQDLEDQLYPWLREQRSNRNPSTNKNQENSANRLDLKNGKVQVGQLKVSDRIKELIRNGSRSSDGYPSRSEADQAVITALVAAGYTKEAIKTIFEQHPDGIGEKYQEKENSKDKYLSHSINSAHSYLQKDSICSV